MAPAPAAMPPAFLLRSSAGCGSGGMVRLPPIAKMRLLWRTVHIRVVLIAGAIARAVRLVQARVQALEAFKARASRAIQGLHSILEAQLAPTTPGGASKRSKILNVICVLIALTVGEICGRLLAWPSTSSGCIQVLEQLSVCYNLQPPNSLPKGKPSTPETTGKLP